MDRIGVFGISWRQGGADALARFTLAADGREERLRRLASEVAASELVYLATCNRVEIAVVAERGVPLSRYRRRLFASLVGRAPEPGEAERALRAWAGEGAIEHLFCVATGLDSARVGETDVANQVRAALDEARALGTLGPRLELVLDEALRVARRVHRSTGIDHGRESLAEIAIERVRARIGRTPGAVLLVGASPMTERCGRALVAGAVPLVVASRSRASAERLAHQLGADARTLDELRADPDPIEAIVCATGAPGAVLSRGDLERLAARAPSGEPPLVVDLAVPADVDPADARAAGVERVGMDDVIAEAERTRERRLVEMADARTLVDEALEGVCRRVGERVLAPLFAALQRRYRETALEGVERLFSHDLEHLGEGEREAVRRWAVTLARRFAHLPTAGLRDVAAAYGTRAVDAFLARADDELAATLRAAAGEADRVRVPEPLEEEGAA